MAQIISILFLFLANLYSGEMEKETTTAQAHNKTFTYLALGDSYTIGEGVSESERYPNQTVEILKSAGMDFEKPLIIAKTGWTTDELSKGIEAAEISGNTYDFVTLLIGVNNQYRGRSVTDFQLEFRQLLLHAIQFTKGNPNHVAVISIPDWGVTPFAIEKGTDQKKVSKEIDSYNKAKKAIAKEMGVHFIEITREYRKIGSNESGVVADKLHPSGLVYRSWSEKLAKVIKDKMEL